MEESERKRVQPTMAVSKTPQHSDEAVVDVSIGEAKRLVMPCWQNAPLKSQQTMERKHAPQDQQPSAARAQTAPLKTQQKDVDKPFIAATGTQQTKHSQRFMQTPTVSPKTQNEEEQHRAPRKTQSQTTNGQPVKQNQKAAGQPQRKAQNRKPASTREQSLSRNKRPKKRKSDLLYAAMGLLLKLGWIVLSLFILLVFVVGVHKNVGVNMEPSFHDRDVIIYNKLASSYEAGDVVIFKGQNAALQAGRIIAKAGDMVEITDGGVKLNGYYQTETYSKGETVQFEGAVTFPMTLGRDEYFILFDNRAQGGDSRTLGKISADAIKGHVILTLRARDF